MKPLAVATRQTRAAQLWVLRHIKIRCECVGILLRIYEGRHMRRDKAATFTAATQAVLVLAAVAVPTAAQAVKGHCPGGQHWQCTTYATSQENGAWYDAKTGQWYNKSCSCQDAGGSFGGGGVGSYGHAEIHKTNVPTVKPSSIGPTSLARPPLGLKVTPRAPTPTFQPGRTF